MGRATDMWRNRLKYRLLVVIAVDRATDQWHKGSSAERNHPMTFISEATSREELQCAILNESDLYKQFDEPTFLNDGYTTEELRNAVIAWIMAGDETAF